ncbi:hypothetical protein FHU30_007433 [Actinomadura rupiterrae]|nr:hypothetical protein [Actinomadura rupiterrae]
MPRGMPRANRPTSPPTSHTKVKTRGKPELLRRPRRGRARVLSPTISPTPALRAQAPPASPSGSGRSGRTVWARMVQGSQSGQPDAEGPVPAPRPCDRGRARTHRRPRRAQPPRGKPCSTFGWGSSHSCSPPCRFGPTAPRSRTVLPQTRDLLPRRHRRGLARRLVPLGAQPKVLLDGLPHLVALPALDGLDHPRVNAVERHRLGERAGDDRQCGPQRLVCGPLVEAGEFRTGGMVGGRLDQRDAHGLQPGRAQVGAVGVHDHVRDPGRGGQ